MEKQSTSDRQVRWAFLGRTDYSACWNLQRRLCDARQEGRAGDTLLLTEHDHVYTIGTTGHEAHLLAGAEELERKGIPLVFNDRGGDITYHGPGQIVGYPILDLHGYTPDLHRYLRDLEEVVIRALALYGVQGDRLPGYTGVWVRGEKICAIGIKTRRWVTMHGFALNVTTDLSLFGRIIPCGIFERGVTSMREILGKEVPMVEVAEQVAAQFGRVFGCAMLALTPSDLSAGEGVAECRSEGTERRA